MIERVDYVIVTGVSRETLVSVVCVQMVVMATVFVH